MSALATGVLWGGRWPGVGTADVACSASAIACSSGIARPSAHTAENAASSSWARATATYRSYSVRSNGAKGVLMTSRNASAAPYRRAARRASPCAAARPATPSNACTIPFARSKTCPTRRGQNQFLSLTQPLPQRRWPTARLSGRAREPLAPALEVTKSSAQPPAQLPAPWSPGCCWDDAAPDQPTPKPVLIGQLAPASRRHQPALPGPAARFAAWE